MPGYDMSRRWITEVGQSANMEYGNSIMYRFPELKTSVGTRRSVRDGILLAGANAGSLSALDRRASSHNCALYPLADAPIAAWPSESKVRSRGIMGAAVARCMRPSPQTPAHESDTCRACRGVRKWFLGPGNLSPLRCGRGSDEEGVFGFRTESGLNCELNRAFASTEKNQCRSA